jgi:hypothetical protein
VFWIAAKNLSELWLSTDDNPENMIMLCSPKFPAPGPGEWAYPSQKSKPIALVAVRAYYFEVRRVFLIHSRTQSFWIYCILTQIIGCVILEAIIHSVFNCFFLLGLRQGGRRRVWRRIFCFLSNSMAISRPSVGGDSCKLFANDKAWSITDTTVMWSLVLMIERSCA